MAEKIMKPIEAAAPYTKASLERLQAMEQALRSVDSNRLEGDIVECGVWQGGHIILARKVSPNRRCWLFDTFNGMVKPGEEDTKRDGGSALAKWSRKSANGQLWVACSVEQVTRNLMATGTYHPILCRFMVGDVCTVLRLPDIDLPEKIAVLRLDTDWYASTKTELEVLWPRVVPGGFIIIDDYGHWLGARKAAQEYFKKHYPAYWRELKPVDYTAVMMQKL